jgi:hypothetical protein
MPSNKVHCGLHEIGRRQIKRISISSGTQGRESNTVALMLHRQFQARSTGRRQQLCFSLTTTLPDWSNGMKDILGRKIASPAHHRAACGATLRIILRCFLHDGWTTRIVYGPIDTATTGQTAVGGIDDRVDVLLGYIALNQFHAARAKFHNHR